MRLWRHFSFLSLLFLGQISWAYHPIRILSLDGGGVRGIVEAVVLKNIEEQLGKPIYQIFDFIAGTSTGGLIALGLVSPGFHGEAPFSAQEILEAYLEFSPKIFNASCVHRLKTLGGLIGPKHDSCGIVGLAEYFLSNRKLSEALIPTLITGYDVENERGVEFFSHEARMNNEEDCLMREVAQATSAAPTYFPLASVKYASKILTHIADGALYKPNPAMLAYVAAKKMYPNTPIEIYSIGSGTGISDTNCSVLKFGGLLQWVSPIMHHIQRCDCATDNEILRQLINTDDEQRFFRLDITLNARSRALDDASRKNMRQLLRKGEEATSDPAFRQIIEKLKGKGAGMPGLMPPWSE